LALGAIQVRRRPFAMMVLEAIILSAVFSLLLIPEWVTNNHFFLGASAVFCLLLCVGLWRHRSMLRLAQMTRSFSALRGSDVVLYHSPTFDPSRLPKLLHEIELETSELRQRFGTTGPNGITVYLLSDVSDLTAIRGRPAGGFAVLPATIVIADRPYLTETIRHQLPHLFLSRSIGSSN